MAVLTSFTLTIHAWWLGAYLAVGVVIWLPLEYLAWRQIAAPREPFWRSFKRSISYHPVLRVLAPIVAWPIALWEVLR